MLNTLRLIAVIRLTIITGDPNFINVEFAMSIMIISHIVNIAKTKLVTFLTKKIFLI